MEEKNLVNVSNERMIGNFSDEEIQVIKNTVAKGATNDELKLFLSLASQYQLNPFNKEIWFIKRVKKVKIKGEWDYPRLANGEINYSGAETLIMTGRDGYLSIAQRNANFGGIISFVVREGDTFEIDAEKYTVNHKFGAKRGRIIGAWSKVEHKGRKPVISWADYSEYYTESPIWKKYPSAMICKVAEVFALKRAFGINGLVSQEELTQVKMEYEAQIKSENVNSEIIDANILEDNTNTSDKISEGTRGMIFGLMKQLNYSKEKMSETVNSIIGREILDSKTLTNQEGEKLIDILTSEYKLMKEQENGNSTENSNEQNQEKSIEDNQEV